MKFFLYKLLFLIPLLQCRASDCLEKGFRITNGTTNLVSQGGMFEFGFFTPDEKAVNRRFLGIWYHKQNNPKIVVWVANRDKPLLDSYGYLVVDDSDAKLLDRNGVAYWSTDDVLSEHKQSMGPIKHYKVTSNEPSRFQLLTGNATDVSNKTRNLIRLCLLNNGNLILGDRRVKRAPLWQSFEHPTDTLLPGMVADGSLSLLASSKLVSWQNHNNPALGKFSFPLQLVTPNDLYIAKRGVPNYWQSGTTPFDKIPSALSGLWNNGNSSLQNNTRLVMNFTGQIQLWNWESERGWSLNWSEPKDGCRLYDKCGRFGSCNSNNGLLCKCLPGFKPTAKWKLGDSSGGCSQKSGPACDRNDSTLNDIFLTFPMMKLGNRTCKVSTSSEGTCRGRCLSDCTCVAYFEGHADCSGPGTLTENKCLTWTELTDLQEESPDGITILVRTTRDDIDPTLRACNHCGTYIIPYPLSTGGNCGNPSYSHFHCNKQTGQVHFSTPSGNFRVNSIDPDNKLFSIQVMHNICDDKYIHLSVLSLNNSLPFTFRNCNVVENQPLIHVAQPFIEVEIGWNPPPEFSCRAPLNCSNWPHTTCKAKGGEMRCICGSKFQWNGSELECTRVPFPLKVVLLSVAGALAIILVCSILSIYHIRKRRMVKGQDSSEFKGDDTEGIDVPFFNWESILAATNNFADANKLGTGGFGSVYRGELPDGQIIAVKRLSSVSVEGIAEFKTEVMLIAKLQHRNLVRLIGYCTKADEKILVYEYMPNGSLDSCLFDERHSVYLDWKKRFEIILGIARGLLYLHQDSRLRIIHRDLKPSNILLDEELNPKISDFGIARIVGGKETEASTGKVVGTYGYMSPEYAYEGIFSLKSDVFSFGVVILETIRGKRNSRIFIFEHGVNLLGHAWKMWNEDQGLELMDPKLNESCIYSEVLRCIHIGLLCVQEDPSDRPSMSTVVHMLSAENASLPPAKQPAFMNRRPLSENASTSSAKDSSGHEVMSVSTVGR